MKVVYEKKDRIAYITINRPEVRNALDPETQQLLVEAWTNMQKDDDVCVGIVSSAGDKAFSAGDDLKSMAARADSTLMDWRLWHPVKVTTGLGTTKPVIAAIHGYCIGGGLELALACDIRIAAENAVFSAPEVKWNRICGLAALELVRVIPMSSAMEILLTGDFFDAKEAYRIGLVSRLVPASELMPMRWSPLVGQGSGQVKVGFCCPRGS